MICIAIIGWLYVVVSSISNSVSVSFIRLMSSIGVLEVVSSCTCQWLRPVVTLASYVLVTDGTELVGISLLLIYI